MSQRSTHFDFAHKVFTVEDCRFILSKSTEEPVMRLKLGKLDVEVPIEKICTEFAIDAKSFDGQLLTMAAKGLKYVREIRPGDTIPNELIDGSASWRVEDRHFELAKGRLTLQMVTWLTGGETVISGADHLEQVLGDPNIKTRIGEAFQVMANRLSLSDNAEDQVEQRIDALARELAYIEALREKIGHLNAIRTGLEAAHRIYKLERTTREEIVRMQSLSLPPIADLEQRLAQVDAHTGEVLVMLKKFDQTLEYIRDMRDDLHQSLMAWDTVLEPWTTLPIEKSPALDALLKETYHFLAKRFSQASQWRLAPRQAPR